MDVKAKREYMMRYQNAQNRIIGLTHEIEKWQGIAEKVNSAINNSGISACDNSSKVERGAINVADIITSIQIEINSKKEKAFTGVRFPGLLSLIRVKKNEKQAVVKAALFLYVHALDCGCDCLRN